MASKMWSKRHYEAIAACIKDHNKRLDKVNNDGRVPRRAELLMLTKSFIDLFEKDNPAFSPKRFLDACGWNDIIGNDN